MALAFQDIGGQQPCGGEVRPQVDAPGAAASSRSRRRPAGAGWRPGRDRPRRCHRPRAAPAGSCRRRSAPAGRCAISGCVGDQSGQDALRLAEVAAARLPARQDLRQAQVHAAEFGLRVAIQLRGIRRSGRPGRRSARHAGHRRRGTAGRRGTGAAWPARHRCGRRPAAPRRPAAAAAVASGPDAAGCWNFCSAACQ